MLFQLGPVWRLFLMALLCGLPFIGETTWGKDRGLFKLHLMSEPQSLDVHKQRTTSTGYFQAQLHGTLLKWNQGLQSDLAESCSYTSEGLKLTCRLKKGLKFSNGKPLEAKHFVQAFERLLSPNNLAPRADLLFPLEGAKAFYSGQIKDFAKVGVKAPEKDQLEFQLAEPDFEFIYNLTSPILAPLFSNQIPEKTKASEFVGSGPFLIEKWTSGVSVLLKPNVHHHAESSKRPRVEMLFIPEDSTALRLYEGGELSFLRRLPTLYIPKYKSRSDYHAVPQHRLDYWGFGKSLADKAELRQKLTQSLNYPELQKLFHAESPPGCPGLKKDLVEREVCYSFKRQKHTNQEPTLSLYFARQGGDDHRRSLEWIQDQWLNHLGLKLQLVGVDQKILPDMVKSKKADLFRKGVSPEAPTCYAVLNNFLSDSPENWIEFQNPEFETAVRSLKKTQKGSERQKLCQKAIEILMGTHSLIPTGRIYFSILAQPQWKGWNLNELNQLDLTNLSQN